VGVVQQSSNDDLEEEIDEDNEWSEDTDFQEDVGYMEASEDPCFEDNKEYYYFVGPVEKDGREMEDLMQQKKGPVSFPVILGGMRLFTTHDSGCPFVLLNGVIYNKVEGENLDVKKPIPIKGVGGGREMLTQVKQVTAKVSGITTNLMVHRAKLGGKQLLVLDKAVTYK